MPEAPTGVGRNALSHEDPRAGCHEAAFAAAYPMDDAGEVALEDYARALTRAGGAEAIRSAETPGAVRGVHLCGLGAAPAPESLRDLEAFAAGLGTAAGGGLGWS